MNLNLFGYTLFLLIITYIIVIVGRICYRNGNIYVLELLPGHQELCLRINKLLLTGYYLVNIGYAAMTLISWSTIINISHLLEVLATKTATIIIILSILHYLIYLPIALMLTFIVSRTLFRNGKVFMLDIFAGRQEIATATNKLFETGFYLLNLGYALLILRLDVYDNTYTELIEELSFKIGGFSIYLGIMLFLNLYLFFRGKRKEKENAQKRVATNA